MEDWFYDLLKPQVVLTISVIIVGMIISYAKLCSVLNSHVDSREIHLSSMEISDMTVSGKQCDRTHDETNRRLDAIDVRLISINEKITELIRDVAKINAKNT